MSDQRDAKLIAGTMARMYVGRKMHESEHGEADDVVGAYGVMRKVLFTRQVLSDSERELLQQTASRYRRIIREMREERAETGISEIERFLQGH